MTDNDHNNANSNGRVRDVHIQHLRDDISELNDKYNSLAEIVTALRIEYSKLSERITLFQAGQGIFTMIATAIGVFIAYMISA